MGACDREKCPTCGRPLATKFEGARAIAAEGECPNNTWGACAKIKVDRLGCLTLTFGIVGTPLPGDKREKYELFMQNEGDIESMATDLGWPGDDGTVSGTTLGYLANDCDTYVQVCDEYYMLAKYPEGY